MAIRIPSFALLFALLWGSLLPAYSQTTTRPVAPAAYPVAVVGFEERGSGIKDYGSKVGDIMYGVLGTNENIVLVDRQDIATTLTEQKLNLSGMVQPDAATRVGQLTGAKVLVTGSVFEAGKSLFLTAKIIGTETTRVMTESVKGATTDDLGTLSETLAQHVGARIVKDATLLMPAPETINDIIADLNKQLGHAQRPALTINIAERHVGQIVIDPAASTEMALIAKATGFNVLENAAGVKPLPLQLTGEGFSELATHIGDLVSVKARLEVKAVDPATNKVIAVDRQTVIVVDLSEQIAGKSALQKAAAIIAQRMLPKLVAAG